MTECAAQTSRPAAALLHQYQPQGMTAVAAAALKCMQFHAKQLLRTFESLSLCCTQRLEALMGWPAPVQQSRHWTQTSVLQEVGRVPVCRLPQAQAQGTK